jgi:hypothetical protein
MTWLAFVWDGPSTNYPASPSTAWASNPVAILPGTAYFTPDKSLPAPALNYVLWALATECQYNFANTAQWQATAYTTSQSVTVPAGCNEVLVELCGGGGGGGAGQAGVTSTSTMATSGAGGGGGQYVLTRLPVTAGDTLVLVVGAGGAAGVGGVASSVTDTTNAASVTAYGGSAGTKGSGGGSTDIYVTGGLSCPLISNPYLGGIGYTNITGSVLTGSSTSLPFLPTGFGYGGAGWSSTEVLALGGTNAAGIAGNYSSLGYAGGAGGSATTGVPAGHYSGGPGGGGGGGAFGVGGAGGTPGGYNSSGAGGAGGAGSAAAANTGGGGGGGAGGGSGSSSGGAGGAGGAGGSGKIVLTFLVYGNNPIG